jgi:hypothetical protein
MSTASRTLPEAAPRPDVLGELLHSLSQPLTSLRCSLELSLDFPREPIEEAVEQRQESVAVALQHIEKVIGMIRLMREYLEADQPRPQARPSALAPALTGVIDELSSIAAVRGLRLHLIGTCTAVLSLPEARLRLALQYLVASLIDAQPAGGKVMLLLGEGPAGTVLRAEAECPCCEPNFPKADPNSTSQPAERNPAVAIPSSAAALRRARLAIATRLLEGAGASLVFAEPSDPRSALTPTGFVLRIAPPCPHLPPS